MTLLTPMRRRGVEYLDDPGVPAATRVRSIRDVVRCNTLLGGAHALMREVARALPAAGTVTMLDVGTGLADLPRRAVRLAAARGVLMETIGCDASPALLVEARGNLTHAICADALALPFRTGSVDLVVCSQLLHHFAHDDAVCLVREMHRVARHAVIVSDLRRSCIAMAGFWLVSFPLCFHPITRHDGVLSVLRGFTRDELRGIVRAATKTDPDVRRYPGWRLTAYAPAQAP